MIWRLFRRTADVEPAEVVGGAAAGLGGLGDPRRPILAALDQLGLPWRETRAALAERYGVQPHPAYRWEVVETPGRPVSGLLWPMSVQMLPQFLRGFPPGRLSSVASWGDDAEENIQRAAEEVGRLLGPAHVHTRYNTRTCEWRAGAASVRLVSWPPELQTSRLTNSAHARDPRIIKGCHVEVETGFRPSPTTEEEVWLESFSPLGSIRGDRLMQRKDVVDLAPPEAQIAFVREPGRHLKKTFGLVGASSDRQALIFCHTQLYLARASSIEAFRVERLLAAKGGGGSYLDVICRTGEADCPTKRLRIHSADEPDALNDSGAALAGFFGAPFQLAEPYPDV